MKVKKLEKPLVFQGEDSMDEINKWILERKKNFPTIKNIERK